MINQIILWSILVIHMSSFFLIYQVSRDLKNFYRLKSRLRVNLKKPVPPLDMRPSPKGGKFKPKVPDDNQE